MAQAARPSIQSITVLLTDGRSLVIEGAALSDPKGGLLAWNDFAVKKILKQYYKDNGEDAKAKRTESDWDGTGGGALPAVMSKPNCSPDPWP
jgi:hypothetical protein